MSEKKRYDFMEAHLGQEGTVLLEDPRDDGFPGYTENYIRVRVPNPGFDIRNRLVKVSLNAIRADWMEASIIEFLEKEEGPRSLGEGSRAHMSGIRVC